MPRSMRSGSAPSALVVALLLVAPQVAWADGYTSTEFQYLFGHAFQEPGIAGPVPRHLVTVQHAAGSRYASVFGFADFLHSGDEDDDANEVYAEGYAFLSAAGLLDLDVSDALVSTTSTA